jgi:molybdenum cofactor cytidylyltransferase
MQPRITGILLAAGRSRRMGQTKQLLPWPPLSATESSGRTTVVAAAFDAIAPWCDSMIVVLGHEASAVAAALAPRRFIPVIANADAPMMESIRAAMRGAASLVQAEVLLLHPADQPIVREQTMRLLLDRSSTRVNRAVMPEYAGRGGHPVLVPRTIVPAVLNYRRDGGLRQFWIDHPALCERVPVDDASVVLDLDTPADYRALR